MKNLFVTALVVLLFAGCNTLSGTVSLDDGKISGTVKTDEAEISIDETGKPSGTIKTDEVIIEILEPVVPDPNTSYAGGHDKVLVASAETASNFLYNTNHKANPFIILFDTDSTYVKHQDMVEPITYLVTHKDAYMIIIGHADQRGDAEYNFALAQMRAENVADFLTDYKISLNRMKVMSQGEQYPKATDTESRRVEIIVN